MNLYRIIAGIIYLKMIQFEESPNNSGSLISESSKWAVERAAALLEIDCFELQIILTERIWRVLNEDIR